MSFRAALVLLVSCTHDVVLPDSTVEPVCGNGVVEYGEQCDVASPGCADCQVVPGWVCNKTSCSVICGDGVSGTGPNCESPHRDASCDMTGWWSTHETDFTRDTVVNHVQVASSWYLYRFSQQGTTFQVEESILCGFHVSGTVNVDPTPGTLRSLMVGNRQDPLGKHGPRKGTIVPVTGGCAMTFSRWYEVRGVSEDWLPADFSQDPPLASLPKIPFEVDPLHPTGANLNGLVDTDPANPPGNAVLISGFVTGVRHDAERDFLEFATLPGKPVPADGIDLVMPGQWDLQQQVVSVSDCGSACPLMAQGAFAINDIPPRVLMHFLGNTLTSDRVSAVVKGDPRASIDADLVTCANIRAMLPHDTNQALP